MGFLKGFLRKAEEEIADILPGGKTGKSIRAQRKAPVAKTVSRPRDESKSWLSKDFNPVSDGINDIKSAFKYASKDWKSSENQRQVDTQNANRQILKKYTQGQLNKNQVESLVGSKVKNAGLKKKGNLYVNTVKNSTGETLLQNTGAGIMNAAPQRVIGGLAEYGGTALGNDSIRDFGTRLNQPFRDYNALAYENADNKAVAIGGNIAGNLLTLPIAPAGKAGLAYRGVVAGAPTAADTGYAIKQAGGGRVAQTIGGGATGIASGYLNSVGGDKILKPVGAVTSKLVGKTVTTKLAPTAFGRIGAGVLNEGGEEVIEQGVDNAVAKSTYDPDRKLTDNLATSFLLGGAMGGVVRGGVELGNPNTRTQLINESKVKDIANDRRGIVAGPLAGDFSIDSNSELGGNKKTTTIRIYDTKRNETTQEIASKPVQITDGVNTVIHREVKYGKDWVVSESTTGMSIATGKTQAEAKANALKTIQKHPEIQDVIAKQQERFGVKPTESRPTKAPVESKTPQVGKTGKVGGELDALKAEARKYKSADEFDNVLQRGVTKPEFAPKPQQYNQLAPKPSKQHPLEALKAEARQATGARSDYSPENLQANRQIRAKNASSITYADKKAIKPDELVTVYRAVPGKAKGGLTEGDWVTPNKEQARLFMKQSWAQDDTGAKIVTKKVKASELRYHADDAKGYVDDELLYVPKSTTDLYNQATQPPKSTASTKTLNDFNGNPVKKGDTVEVETIMGTKTAKVVDVTDGRYPEVKYKLAEDLAIGMRDPIKAGTTLKTRPEMVNQSTPKTVEAKPPTPFEQDLQTAGLAPQPTKGATPERANGLPELQSTQAAQRLLKKQGIDWKKPKSDPLESLKQEARPPANAFQDTLPSKSRPASIRELVKRGGNPLYHDTNASGVLGILDSGEIRASQAPFSQIAGQGKRVSTTRNFDNYSRYGKSPYRFVIDETKTKQKSIPDNREEFESIFRKNVKTDSVETLAIDITNPEIINDMNNGRLAEVIAKAKEKGIRVETFEGKILPDEYANKEIQQLTKDRFTKEFGKATQPPKSTPVQPDPLESLKQEAKKYKSAEEFGESLNLMKWGKVTGVGELPISKLSKSQMKVLLKDGLPENGGSLKVSDFKKGRQITQPIEVSQRGSAYVVENGRHRLFQALANGDENVPVVFKGGEGKAYSTPVKDLYNQATQSQPPKAPVEGKASNQGVSDRRKPVQDKVNRTEPKRTETAPKKPFIPDEIKAIRAKREANTSQQTRTDQTRKNQQALDSKSSVQSQPESKVAPRTGVQSISQAVQGRVNKISPQKARQGIGSKGRQGLLSGLSSKDTIQLSGVNVNDPFNNRKIGKRLKNEFGRYFVDEDAEMINLMKRIEKETGQKDLVETWLQDSDLVRNTNSIANSKIRRNENLKLALRGLSKKQQASFDEYASARTELSNLERGLESSSKPKEQLQQIVRDGNIDFGNRFIALNNYYGDWAKDLHDAGIISKSKLDDWSQNKDYVRVQRDMEDILNYTPPTGKSRSFGTTSTSKKRTGSTREILSPTNIALERGQQLQLEIQRNKAASNTIDTLEKYGLAEKVSQQYATGKNVVKRFKDGKVEYFATSKDVKRVIENVNPFQLGVLGRVISTPTRLFRSGTTALSAPFATTNYARDQISSAIYSDQALPRLSKTAQGNVEYIAGTHSPKNIVSGIASATKDYFGGSSNPLWEKFEQVAGDQTQFDEMRNTRSSKATMRELRQGGKGALINKIVNPVRSMEDLIGITEKATRFQNFKGIYEAEMKRSGNEKIATQKASQAALQNSVNFTRAGKAMRVINLLLPYSNAGIQGSRNVARSFRKRPVATTMKSVAFVAVPTVLLTLMNYDDEETAKVYKNIDDTEKDDNFIIVLKGAKQNEAGSYEGIIKIPKPQGYRELTNPLRIAAERFAGNEKSGDVSKMVRDAMSAFTGPVSIEDSGKFISSLIPQAVKPTLQAIENKDYYWDSQTVPDYMIDGTDDPTKRAYKSTSGTARIIADQLGVSPILVEKFIQDTAGSVGRYGINLTDRGLNKLGIVKDDQIGGKTITGDFKRRTTEARAIEKTNKTDGQRYYDNVEKATGELPKYLQDSWKSYNTSDKNFLGEVLFEKNGQAKKQAKAAAYIEHPELFEVDKKLDKLNRKKGETGNPLYDLSYNQALIVVQEKALPPGAKDEGLNALYDQQWYSQYKNKEEKYYDKIFGKGGIEENKDNPYDAWTNTERAKLGLPPIEDRYAKYESSSGKSGSSGGSRGRSRRGSSGGSSGSRKGKFDYKFGAFAPSEIGSKKSLRKILEEAQL